MTIKMLVPFKLSSDVECYATPLGLFVERPTLALIDNGKMRAKDLLTKIGDILKAREKIASYFVHTKTGVAPMESDEVERVRNTADLVVVGVGDCGGCSSCAVLDAVEFLNQGTLALVIASKPFEYVVNVTARERNASGLEYGLVDHPVYTRDDDWIAAAAGRLADIVMHSIDEHTRPPASIGAA
jgi:hypothetical protein